jgi:S1-C subfamily serine protease
MPLNLLAAFSSELEVLVDRAERGVVNVEVGGGTGTGFVLPGGEVVTNAHVLRGGGPPIVRERGGRGLVATVLGTDPATDLAVLRVEDLDADPLQLATVRPRVGALVVAIGNPLRFDRSVSIGIVSAHDRSLRTQGHPLEGLLQTDAAINPGNSGGPLLGADGLVVGVNTARAARADGIGFAVPSTTLSWVARELVEHQRVRRRQLGVRATGVPLGPRESARTGQTSAVRVAEVHGGSAAARSGVKAGDLLLDANGQTVCCVADLQQALLVGQPDVARLRVLRDGKRIELNVSLPGEVRGRTKGTRAA